MKKSEILTQVIDMVGNSMYSNFICNVLKHDFTPAAPGVSLQEIRKSHSKCWDLVEWIENSIKHAPNSIHTGVEAWLTDEGHYNPEIHSMTDMIEYRKLWLKDMAALAWVSSGVVWSHLMSKVWEKTGG